MLSSDELVIALRDARQAILVFDNSKCVFASEEFRSLSGLSVEELGDLPSLFSGGGQRSSQTGRFEAELVRAEGASLPVDVAIATTQHDGNVRQIVFIRDAVEMKRLADAFNITRGELDGAMRRGPFTIVELDPQGHILQVSGTGLPLLGLPAGFLRGFDAVAYAQVVAPHLVGVLKRALTGEPFAEKIVALGRTMECHFGPVRDDSGRIVSIAGIAIDVTVGIEPGIIPKALAIARPLVRTMVHDILALGLLDTDAMSVVGRRIAADSHAIKLEDFLVEYEEGGLGTLRCVEAAPIRWRFEGANLFEVERGSRKATCHIALGFLCGALSKLHDGASTVGAEISCESRGHPACEFRIAIRP